MEYEYGRIGKLAEKLGDAGVEQTVIDQIMAGGEAILRTTKPEKKADWMRDAMKRMNSLLDPQTKHAVRESCACCLGGKRLKLSKEIARKHSSLEDRIEAANKTPFVFGNSVTMEENGKIVVRFDAEGKEQYRCVCLTKATEPLPITYCYCCGGHMKHHLQIALGQKLSCKARSSALSSGGKKNCVFEYVVVEE